MRVVDASGDLIEVSKDTMKKEETNTILTSPEVELKKAINKQRIKIAPEEGIEKSFVVINDVLTFIARGRKHGTVVVTSIFEEGKIKYSSGTLEMERYLPKQTCLQNQQRLDPTGNQTGMADGNRD